MAREKKKAPAPVRGVQARTRRAKFHKADTTWRALNPLKEPPKLKHKSYFELVENADKKKKLEFKIMVDKKPPPPGFEFIPIGHPRLTQLCKELSREEDAMIFIVSKSADAEGLDHHVNRVGYHFRQMIVDQARLMLSEAGLPASITSARPGEPEPIPESQAEIDRQADAVLRDLFPRIPHIDRKEIIQHSFRKHQKFNSKYTVGNAKDLSLARRVQLAAIAYIRHNHTRYDELLRTTTWANARKAVEKPCLDIIVKWRGDEETGRDQLDEILREVIEISDTEEESEDDISNGEPMPVRQASLMPAAPLSRRTAEPQGMRHADYSAPSQAHRREPSITVISSRQKAITKAEKKNARKTRRFRRYAAAAEALAGSSGQNDHANISNAAPLGSVPMDLTRSPVNPSREPTVMAPHTPVVEPMPRYFETRTDSQRFESGSRLERMPLVPRGPPEGSVYASPQSMHIPESQRPKVGRHPLTNFNHSEVSLSPVRHGLQDMILQSIEPASPVGPRVSHPQDASHTQHRDPRCFAEAPRATTRTVYEPVGSTARARSPRGVMNGNEMLANRYHVTDHQAGGLGGHTGSSFINVNHRLDRGEETRRTPVGYVSNRPISSFRATDQALSQHQPWPIPSGEVAQHNGVVPLRNRANPIVVDDDPRRRPHLVERQWHPNEDYQEAPPLRRGEEIIRDAPFLRDVRIKEEPPVVYVREEPLRPRSAFDYSRGPSNHPTHGLASYEEHSYHRMPVPETRHRVVVNSPLNHESSHYREPPHGQYQVREPVERADVPRDVRGVRPGLDGPDARYISSHHDPRAQTNFIRITEPHQDHRGNYRHEPAVAREVGPPQLQHPHEHQSTFANPPTHSHYTDNRNYTNGNPYVERLQPLRHDTPGRSHLVWVDR